MVLDNLGSSLKNTFRKLAGMSLLDKEAVESIVKDLQRTLLQSDADVELVYALTSEIKKKVLRAEVPPVMTLKEYFIKTLYDSIVSFLG